MMDGIKLGANQPTMVWCITAMYHMDPIQKKRYMF